MALPPSWKVRSLAIVLPRMNSVVILPPPEKTAEFKVTALASAPLTVAEPPV